MSKFNYQEICKFIWLAYRNFVPAFFPKSYWILFEQDARQESENIISTEKNECFAIPVDID